jgi:hypothetical protein
MLSGWRFSEDRLHGTIVVFHPSGLWFDVATELWWGIVREPAEAQAICAALNKAVEDGLHGQVDIEVTSLPDHTVTARATPRA